MPEIKWIKIVTDIFDDEKIALIETLPDGDSIIVLWFKLLCLAGKQNNCGVFMLNEKIAYTDEMLATIFRRPLNTVRLGLQVFEQYGMVEIINGVYTIPNWDKHQALDSYEKRKEQNRINQQLHRERQKMMTSQSCQQQIDDMSANVSVAEEDKKKNKKENKIYIFSEYASGNSHLLTALNDFEQMRKTIKKPMTDRAKTLLCGKLDKFPEAHRIPILEQSIEHCWADIYPLKEPVVQANTESYNIEQAVNDSYRTPTVKKREKR